MWQVCDLSLALKIEMEITDDDSKAETQWTGFGIPQRHPLPDTDFNEANVEFPDGSSADEINAVG